MKVTVEGELTVNSVRMRQASEDVIVLHADTAAKYPKVDSYESDSATGMYGVTFFEHGIDESTTVRFVPPPGEWSVHAAGGRYSLFIFLTRKGFFTDEDKAPIIFPTE